MADWDPFADPASDNDAPSAPQASNSIEAKEIENLKGDDWEDPFLDPNETSIGRAEHAAKMEEMARKAAEAYEASLANQKSLPSWVKGSRKPDAEKVRPSGYQGVRHVTPSNGHKGHVAYLDDLSVVPSLPQTGTRQLEHVEPPPVLEIADDGWVLIDSEVHVDDQNRLRPMLKEDLRFSLAVRGDLQMLRPAADVPEFAPIRHLGECSHPGCSANRDRNPQARPKFIEFVVRHISEKWAGTGEITYASLGSGELLMDFLILERLRDAGVRVGQVHLVDPLFEPRTCTGYAPARLALAQFSSWFSDLLVYAHPSIETLRLRCRRASTLLQAVVLADCLELSSRWEEIVKPTLEESMEFEGLHLNLTTAGHKVEGVRTLSTIEMHSAFAQAWCLNAQRGRLQLVEEERYVQKQEVKGEALPVPKSSIPGL